MSELNGELSDELPEEVWVAVLAKLVEDEPVSNLTLAALRDSTIFLSKPI